MKLYDKLQRFLMPRSHQTCPQKYELVPQKGGVWLESWDLAGKCL